MARKIDSMSKEDVIVELVRIASRIKTEWDFDAGKANDGFKTPAGAQAIGRREICRCVLDDFAVTFGIEVE